MLLQGCPLLRAPPARPALLPVVDTHRLLPLPLPQVSAGVVVEVDAKCIVNDGSVIRGNGGHGIDVMGLCRVSAPTTIVENGKAGVFADSNHLHTGEGRAPIYRNGEVTIVDDTPLLLVGTTTPVHPLVLVHPRVFPVSDPVMPEPYCTPR